MAVLKNSRPANADSVNNSLLSQFGTGPILPVPHHVVHEAFESIVDTYPAAIAAKFGDATITYRQLDIAANRLAHVLIDSGLKPRQRVCLVVQRSFEMLTGILAILKAGCQYVPIDGGVASEQAMRHIFRDTDARYILCLPRFSDKVRECAGGNAIILALDGDTGADARTERPRVTVTARDGAYAIYTSGSTGMPKGVDVSHGNVTNALTLEPAKLGIRVGSKVAQVLSIAFDMGAWEILGCIMNGGTLYLRGSDWRATLREVDTFISTPSILSKYTRSDLPNLRTIVTGGEPCPQVYAEILADEWAQGTCYYNICGPTEITILNSAHRHVSGRSISIGRPLPNTTCYILDENEQLVPFGEKGVMWVGGAGVTRGYINLPELTSQRYKKDKFANDGSIMFNTGDIVRWREDGSLETFGRMDDQVKIKGFRVELDGVSAVIEKFPGITRAAAMVVDADLHGFYTAETLIDEQDVETFAQQHLPYYSVPKYWHFAPAIPLTPNGKVDKKALRELALRDLSTTDSRADSGAQVDMTVPNLPAPPQAHQPKMSGCIFSIIQRRRGS
ncbi:similar to amino acid adenylation domain-containing protein [Plenodomus lingam JN3]|uniref:Similar to amino acid adenylation domain-containing protein n=1 Tax=Leptosphaeria maculans (strain JN3 / isolate v23.1.3 / race Av1-4-5-6-7-8) TaxID=985895 RepID=E4ZGF7_LEPMJ|nr:similar to amino acid adenylation domain-containing protein [Plenodomus lingam JN3]CBX90377.1 similar to amino acid adenylation domain-containing protein [Plenodomus lingam JN3]